MKRLIELGAITQEAADFLEKLVRARYNIFISGGTGAGKTTFLNILSGFIPKEERVITIEDSAELQIQHVKNLVRLESRNENIEGENEVTIRELIRSALRMRPDRVVVGEVRDEVAIDMLQAMNTGHLVRASYQRFYQCLVMTIGKLTNTVKQGEHSHLSVVNMSKQVFLLA